MAIRAPLDFVHGVTGGAAPNIRVPLDFVHGVTGGYGEHIRTSLDYIAAVTGGPPGISHIRVALNFICAVVPEPEPLPVATYRFPTQTTGIKWDRQKEPSGNNARREMTSGKRSVTPFMIYPRWNFTVDFEVAPDNRYVTLNPKIAAVNAIIDLYKNTLFGAYTFLYHDKDDYHIVGGSIATGDGVTLQWPFFAPIMGETALEPVGQIDLDSYVSFASSAVNTGTNQINIPGHGFTTGQEPPVFVSNTGGSLPTGLSALTPYWIIAVDANNISLATTLPRALANDAITLSATGSGTDTISKGWAAYRQTPETDSVPGSPAYTITVTNAATFASDEGVTHSGTPLTKVAGTPGAGQYAVDTTTGVYTFNAAQASASVVITYTYRDTNTTLTLPNQLVFGSAPTSGDIITADFDFFFVCRFDEDKLPVSEFASRLYEIQKLTFSSEV
jgi:hypothetical protein